ncbi:MAG: cyclase family protein [Acidobacteriota bacterium]|nr:cyclase family protein [Acidobacteriota bacterium]
MNDRTPAWPGDVPFSWRPTASLIEGSPYESSCFTMSAHLGTHADAPSHVVSGGASAGALPLERFLGRARVVDLPGRGEIGADALPARALGSARILFRTRGLSFLSPLAAVRLAERGALLVGTDGGSIDPEDAEDLPVHRALLERGVLLLENLDLSAVEPGDYSLIALPLRVMDLDAAPVRAVLIKG